MKVKLIHYNWYQSSNGSESGEDYNAFEVGRNDVSEIIEHEPRNGMQLWNYIVRLNNGTIYRVFNPNFVEYFRTVRI